MPEVPYDTHRIESIRCVGSYSDYHNGVRKDHTTFGVWNASRSTHNGPKVETSADFFRPSTPYGTATVSYKYLGGSLVRHRGDWVRRYDGNTPVGPYSTTLPTLAFGGRYDGRGYPAFEPNALNRATTEALLKLKDKQIDLGLALAESRQTLSFVASKVMVASRVLLAARRGHWNQVRRHLGLSGRHISSTKRWGDTWLEYSYAFAPLANDISSGLRILGNGLTNRPQVFSVVRKITDSPMFWPTSQLLGSGKLWFTGEITRTHTVKLFATVTDLDAVTNAALGISPNPATAAYIGWNMIPYSFVVDWLVPVGSVLEALDAHEGYEFLGGYRSVKVKDDFVAHYSLGREFAGSIPVAITGEGYTREPLWDWPRPVPYVKSPFSSSHLISAFALMQQVGRH